MKKKKKKDKREREQCTVESLGGPQVLLSVRVTEAERQRIKVYAARQGSTIAGLVRRYISSLPEVDQQ